MAYVNGNNNMKRLKSWFDGSAIALLMWILVGGSILATPPVQALGSGYPAESSAAIPYVAGEQEPLPQDDDITPEFIVLLFAFTYVLAYRNPDCTGKRHWQWVWRSEEDLAAAGFLSWQYWKFTQCHNI